MVRNAFSEISDIPSRLFAFSDDMDGMRKIPDNVPNQDLLSQHLDKPLTSVPDPFGTHESFGHHNNSRLRGFLDKFGFDYEFKSATECYKSGIFDEILLKILQNYEAVINVILPTLVRSGELIACFCQSEKTAGCQVPVERRLDNGTIIYKMIMTH